MSGMTQDTVVDGRYRIVNRVGSGGMADVWCAEDLQLGRRVALKLLHRRFAEDADFVERFRREASSAAGLQHPHVVSVYDRGEWDGTYYIAMEFLEGETLKSLIEREAPLAIDHAIELAIQILRAARFAHRRSIIHRDLKPHNVIVDAEGRAKVTDFGIARAGPSDMTETGSIMGTAQYLSPEQAQGTPVSAQSDIYAVGVILYEMLTGSVPFDGDSPVTVALKQVSEPPVPPSHLNPAVTLELESVVLRAMAKEPEARFPDDDAFIDALEMVRAGGAPPEGVATTAFGAVAVEDEVAGPVPRRTRWWPWALLAALLVGAAIVAALLLAREETREVPRVTGADAASAAQRLRNDGFEPVIERVVNRAPRDEVIAQDPLPGTELEVGGEVTLRVSEGPGTRPVPDVEGLSARRARARLEEAGFRVRARRAPSDEVDEGDVIRTAPPAGSEVEAGRTVTLVISSGREQVAVPDLVGSNVQDARDELEEVGLTADVTRQETDAEAPDTVLRQDPAAGARVDAGSSVRIVVAQEPVADEEEPSEVAVPDVTGRDESEAVGELSAAGLEVDIVEREVDRPSQDRVVQRQSPGAGARLSEGERVRIVVGRFEPALDPEPEDPATNGTGGEADGTSTTGGASAGAGA